MADGQSYNLDLIQNQIKNIQMLLDDNKEKKIPDKDKENNTSDISRKLATLFYYFPSLLIIIPTFVVIFYLFSNILDQDLS